MIGKILASLMLLVSLSLAAVYMQAPFTHDYVKVIRFNSDKNTYDLGDHYLGKLSPGQSIRLVFSRDSGTPYDWDNLLIYTSPGLRVSYEKTPKQFVVTLNAVSEDRNAWVEIYFMEEFMFRGTERIVFRLDVTPEAYTHYFVRETVPAAEDSYYVFKVKSESLADDVILARIEGLPRAWAGAAEETIKSGQEIEVRIPLKATEEGRYPIRVKVEYASGLKEEFQRELWVKPTMKSKMKSVGEGFVLVPGLLQPLYSLVGFIGSLL